MSLEECIAEVEALSDSAATASVRVLANDGGRRLALSGAKSLLVLDASFNPPHLAHKSLIRHGLAHLGERPSAVLLMYAVRNADKAVKHARENGVRVALMRAFQESVRRELHDETYICLTQEPYFKDKFLALAEQAPAAAQIYLVGYDTFVRILDKKYYGGNLANSGLGDFFSRGRLLCALRDGQGWGDYARQKEHVDRIRSGREPDVPAAWADSIDVVTLADDEGMGVSSTAVRQAVASGDEATLSRLLSPEVLDVIKQHNLYQPDAAEKDGQERPDAGSAESIKFPYLKRADVMACSFSHWHARFRHCSPRARVLRNPPQAFLAYLDEDGLMLPQDSRSISHTVVGAQLEQLDSSDDEAETRVGQYQATVASYEDEGFSEVDPVESFREFHEAIQREIDALGGKVVPKLNWSAPKDAVWISADRTMKCREPGDIYLLLKSSDFVNHDLGGHAFDACDDTPKGQRRKLESEECVLVLKKWFDARPSLEFRCFVTGKRLRAISQRDPNPYDFLAEKRAQIVELATRLFDKELSPKFELDNYAYDVYLSFDQDKVWLMDISPCSPSTDGLLFRWQELLAFDDQDPVELRLVSKETTFSNAPQFSAHQVPLDMVDASQGKTVAEFAEEFQTRLARASEQ